MNKDDDDPTVIIPRTFVTIKKNNFSATNEVFRVDSSTMLVAVNRFFKKQ
jgi:hypothetical protein